MAVDRVAEAAFQRPPGLGRGLRLAEFALVKLPSDAAGADLTDRDQMQRPIQLTVAGSGEPVAALLAAGGLDRRGAAVAGVVVAAREPFDWAAVPVAVRRQHGRVSVDLRDARPGGDTRGGDVLAVAPQRGVQPPQVGDQP